MICLFCIVHLNTFKLISSVKSEFSNEVIFRHIDSRDDDLIGLELGMVLRLTPIFNEVAEID